MLFQLHKKSIYTSRNGENNTFLPDGKTASIDKNIWKSEKSREESLNNGFR